MAHTLVKITSNDDGDKIQNPKWHWIMTIDADRTLCGGEAFGEGESNAKFKLKTLKKGGITCPLCLSIIKEIKAIEL